MAPKHCLLLLAVAVLLSHASLTTATRRLTALYKPNPDDLLKYHHGAVLAGAIPVSVLYYGRFSAAQKAVISDFIISLSPEFSSSDPSPSVAQWWNLVDKLYLSVKEPHQRSRIVLAGQVSDRNCSLGKTLTSGQIAVLAGRARARKGGVALVLTADDVAVEGFCMSRCGLHASVGASVYAWVGNSVAQCPGMCAWPFHQPVYGPQAPPLVAPSGDAGVDGMVINIASMIAGAVTNPFGEGFYQGDRSAPLEAATACPGVYAKGAYPGYPGSLLVDGVTGASYNANGARGRRYLVPALFDPSTASCSTLV